MLKRQEVFCSISWRSAHLHQGNAGKVKAAGGTSRIGSLGQPLWSVPASLCPFMQLMQSNVLVTSFLATNAEQP